MKNTILALWGVGLVLGAGPVAAQETAAARLEKGVELMHDEQTLREAIRQFEGVLRAERMSDKLAAEARYHLAKCHLLLGDTERAAEEVARLREKGPPEDPWVLRAAELIPEPELFGEVPWPDGEFLVYDIRTPDGSVVGHLYSVVAAADEQGEASWITWTLRQAEMLLLSRSEFLAGSYRPLRGRAVSPITGELAFEVGGDGSLAVTRPGSDERIGGSEAVAGGWTAAPFYENDQTIHLMRMLSDDVGHEVTLTLSTALHGGTGIEFKLKATDHEPIETAAGRFDCVKYESNIGQDFWVEREGARRIVRMRVGAVNIDLASGDEQWDRHEPLEVGADSLGVRLELPAGLIWLPVADKAEIFRMGFVDSEFRVHEGMVEIQPTGNFEEHLRESEDALLDTMVAALEKQYDECEEIAGSRGSLEADGRQGRVARLQCRKGEIESEQTFHVAHGESMTAVLRCSHRAGLADEAAEMLGRMFGSLQGFE